MEKKKKWRLLLNYRILWVVVTSTWNKLHILPYIHPQEISRIHFNSYHGLKSRPLKKDPEIFGYFGLNLYSPVWQALTTCRYLNLIKLKCNEMNHSVPQALATVQVLSSHMWPAVIISNSADMEHFHHCGGVLWKVLIWNMIQYFSSLK